MPKKWKIHQDRSMYLNCNLTFLFFKFRFRAHHDVFKVFLIRVPQWPRPGFRNGHVRFFSRRWQDVATFAVFETEMSWLNAAAPRNIELQCSLFGRDRRISRLSECSHGGQGCLPLRLAQILC